MTFTNESASGWQQATFSSPVPVTAGTTYVASYYAPNGRYAEDDGYFAAAGYGSSPLYALADGEDGANSVYRIGTGFPTGTYQSANYWVDVVFSTGSTTPETDTTPPSITSRTPASGATGVSVGTTVTATFSEPIQVESVAVSVKDTGGNAVAGTKVYDSSTRTVRFTPSAALAATSAYNVTVSGAKDAAENVMADDTWSFTTGAVAPSGTYSVWSSTDTPATPSDPDTAAVEVGTKFCADVTGKITGIRFYKGTGNSGTHVGHLWSSSGQQLGSVTFSGETATGWQQATFATPITVTSGTTYVASYYAPSGRYAADEGFFTASGVDSGPLHALRNGVDGSNGVYRYGTGGGFPASSYNATNYWVDVVFTTGS